MEKKSMNDVQEQDRAVQPPTVFPALIQVQGIPGVLPSAKRENRRIWLLLDHPVARHLAAFSWLLLAVGLAARHPRRGKGTGIGAAAVDALGVRRSSWRKAKPTWVKARPCAMFTLRAPGLFTEPGAELHASGTPHRSS
jgi:hypothetical protein